MKNKVSSGRVIISLCMDKERDEKLINFLNSKPNKSDYIRNILNEKLDMIENPPMNNNEFVTNTLLEILSNLSSLTDKVVSLGDTKSHSTISIPANANTTSQNIYVEPISEQNLSSQQAINQDLLQNDNSEDGFDMVFNNVLNAIHNA